MVSVHIKKKKKKKRFDKNNEIKWLNYKYLPIIKKYVLLLCYVYYKRNYKRFCKLHNDTWIIIYDCIIYNSLQR